MTFYDFSNIVLQIKIQMVDDIKSVLLGAFVIATARCQNDDIQLFFYIQKDGLATPATMQ